MQPEEADDEDRIPLFSGTGDDYGDEPGLGPDERDRDLMDGSWEQQYYSGRQRTRDWGAITVGLGLLVLISLLVPMILVVVR